MSVEFNKTHLNTDMSVCVLAWGYLIAMKVDISVETDSMQTVHRTSEETWSCIPYLWSLSYMDNALTSWDMQFSCESRLKSYLLSDSSCHFVYLRFKVETINTFKSKVVNCVRGEDLFNCSSLRVRWRKQIMRKSYWRNHIFLISKVNLTNNKTAYESSTSSIVPLLPQEILKGKSSTN